MKKLYIIGAIALCVASCRDASDDQPIPPGVENQEGSVRLNTRVEGEASVVNINAGLYMVNYVDGKQDNLLAADNYVNNQLLVYADNAWNTSKPIYWMDADTPADFYAYAPYVEKIDDARAMQFSVQTNQTSDEAVAKSDFLWGKLQGQSPTESSFDLTLSHVLSQLTIKVVASGDFAESIKAEDVSVIIGGVKTSALIDLAIGEIAPEGEVAEVKCHDNGDLSYTAILIPQQVPFSNLVQILWNGNPYILQYAFKLEPKRQYTLTVKLKKTEGGFDVGIDGWDIIGEDFGGTVGG